MKNKDKDGELQIFNNPEFGELRTIEEGDKIYFVASDVAKALGYKRPADAVSAHCRYTVKRSIPHPQGKGTLQMNVIPEGDVYRLAAHSELPSAEKFESWVFDEVLPTIRKTGGYHIPQLTPNPHYRTRMIGTAVRDVGKTAEALEKVFGCRRGMALATASSMVGEAYGIDMTLVQRLIPAEDNPGTLSPSQIAESLGLFNRQGNPDAQTVNRMLQSCGLQDKPRDTSGANLKNAKWFLTEEGKSYGEQKPMDNKKTGYKGYQICWNADVLSLLRKTTELR